MFSESTLSCLYDAGWHQEYLKDISIYQQLAASERHPLPPVVTQFLQKFGCLHIRYPAAEMQRKAVNLNDGFRLFNDLYVTCNEPLLFYEDLNFIADKIGISDVYEIGNLEYNDGLLLMSNDEKVYLFYGSSKGGSALYVGDSGEEAIEALCSNKKLTQIKEW